ncbi:RNA polymerase sigma factor [Tumebacillus amylolyticus]|uniref:RNA polymerase sigma factor n=1 Tax=Tumebacillus amylolyticus TaxID=2801339 RepID=UPI001F410707|nr:sigma-70 family RNA polymerase sigma factor [Tumebacillus amylolyticus]
MTEIISDLELLRQVAGGDREALGMLYDRYERLVYSLAYRVVQDPQTAEEVVQDVFTRVWQKHALYDPALAKFSTWLLQVARNRAIDVLKSRRRQQESVSDDTLLQTVADASPQTEEQVLQAIEQEEIRDAMRELNPEQRDVIHWMYFDGWTQQEISNRQDIPLGTVKSRVRLALNRLRQTLGKRKEGRADEPLHTHPL